MVEDTGFSRRLFRYVWVGESWHREGPFDAVDRERRRDVRPRVTDISDVYEGCVALDTIRIVVEEGVILRWWHTYIFQANEWLLCNTYHAVAEDDDLEDGMLNEVEGLDFVDDLNEDI